MSGFESIGKNGPVCIDGVCELPEVSVPAEGHDDLLDREPEAPEVLRDL
jgi:hypothetical protein